jgi:hypothetical protein
MTGIELNECPWCHLDEALRIERVDRGEPEFWVRCDNCGCAGPFGNGRVGAAVEWNERRSGEQQSIDAWNEYANGLINDPHCHITSEALDCYMLLGPCKKCGSHELYICDPRENDLYQSIFVMCKKCNHEADHPKTNDIAMAIKYWNEDNLKEASCHF